jgi:hypothetical protein
VEARAHVKMIAASATGRNVAGAAQRRHQAYAPAMATVVAAPNLRETIAEHSCKVRTI